MKIDSVEGILNLILMILVAAVGWMTRNAYISVKDDQKALWDQVNNRLVPRKEFEMLEKQMSADTSGLDRKLDLLTKKVDDHFTWELNRERRFKEEKNE